MLSTKELTYEQEICNILKETTIHQKLEKLKEKTKATGHEHAFDVCSDNRVTGITEGKEDAVDTKGIDRVCKHHVDLTIHSHPNDTAYPSTGDFISDIAIPSRIASCVYGEKEDKITCYRTSDELRNKYRQLLIDIRDKSIEIIRKYDNSTDPEEQRRLIEEYEIIHNKYKDLATNIAKEVALSIYPNLKSIKYPYGKEGDDYSKIFRKEPRFGNFGDVWIKDCGKV